MTLPDAIRDSNGPGARPPPALEALGDSAWLLRFGERLDPELNARVHWWARQLRGWCEAGGLELVPAFASLAVHFDPSRDDAARIHAELEAALSRLAHEVAGARAAGSGQAGPDGSAVARDEPDAMPRRHEIAVVYGGEDGPDLAELARHAGLDPEEVVRRHVATEFQVAMLGFQPGFPYLLGLDPALAMPRLPNPRARVPAGSVGIGGAQCGIYPRTSPGGWRLIGRTAAVLFDPRRDPPALLAAGDRVRFRAVNTGAISR